VTPVKQTKLFSPEGIHNGNCLAACFASLLDLPLWMVPPWEDMFGRGDYWSRIDTWLARMFGLELVVVDGHPLDELPEFYMAVGVSARGVHHAVIYSAGQLVHDPHYSDAGIKGVETCRFLRPIAKAAAAP
jgi:hypothetical protein